MKQIPGRRLKKNPLLTFSLVVAFLLLVALMQSGMRDARFWLALAAIILSILCNVLVLFLSFRRRPPPGV
jgi:ABC-type Fe3+-siderophore transport system permease subunit